MNSIGDLVENANFKLLSDEEKQEYLKEKSIPYFKKLWDSAFKKQSAKEEKEILIDHGFDGITELDNQLPKWWLGLFYFTIASCVVYLFAFAFTDYAHPDVEYQDEAKFQLASIKEYEKTAPAIDLETATYNSENIAEGEQIFKTNCVSCHSDSGKGGIGPNLTDKNWINIKQKSLFKNVFWMLENGTPNNATFHQRWRYYRKRCRKSCRLHLSHQSRKISNYRSSRRCSSTRRRGKLAGIITLI